MKEFVLLFRMDLTTKEVQPSKEQMNTYMNQWWDWINFIDSKGQLAKGGNHFSKKGTVLKSNNIINDGPFIENKTSVSGYILILAKNFKDATSIALKCPILEGENTSVEIREIDSPGK